MKTAYRKFIFFMKTSTMIRIEAYINAVV